MQTLPDGLIVILKRACPTCALIEPVLAQLAGGSLPLTVIVQDTADFDVGRGQQIADDSLEWSWQLNCEIVPTLIHRAKGAEVDRTYGWFREDWEKLSGVSGLGADLPASRPGCGSKTQDPGVADRLAIRFGAVKFNSREVEIGESEDPIEACHERGWSDGLPVVPPTPERVYRMLQGTTRKADEVLGLMPPDLVPCTVEKVAINAVMAGCKPEYMPVVLAAVEAALIDEFGMHGLLCTTMFASPLVLVNGPAAKRVGMNSGVNCLGQGNRANASIGRALQLVVRNIGGGRPGEIDRATMGTPGKYTFCFAEAEDSDWDSLAVERGFSADQSVVTLFAAEGVQAIVDQKSRTPESLARSFALSLRSVDHYKLVMHGDAMLVVSPEHCRVFTDAGWSKARLHEELGRLLTLPGKDLVMGAQGITEGMPENFAGADLPKFRPGGLMIVRAGGPAGLFSAVIAGWAASGPTGSTPVSKEVLA
ncbi:thioredoxin domain-containing protein [Halopseudomonas salina]|uniref:thioredoxin n=1 Tax=Halopseudomonas salina TaxID=1323744 RepID=UPI00123C1355|nr:thioredoxin [Halopseudomonas salina]